MTRSCRILGVDYPGRRPKMNSVALRIENLCMDGKEDEARALLAATQRFKPDWKVEDDLTDLPMEGLLTVRVVRAARRIAA